MIKYYTKACNFYFGAISKEKVKKKLSIPLNGNNLISFDMVEILSRKSTKKISIKRISKLKGNLRKKILFDIKKFQKKIFQRFKI